MLKFHHLLHPVVDIARVSRRVDQLLTDAVGKLARQSTPIGVNGVIPDRFFVDHTGEGGSAVVHVWYILVHRL